MDPDSTWRRRRVLPLLLGGCTGLLPWAATHAATATTAAFPSKPIRIVLPVPAGGSVDAISRLLAEELQRTLGQPVLVESRAGVSGLLASEFVRTSAPDGHTLLFTLTNHLTNPLLFANARYDPVNDFEPVVQAVEIGALLVINSKHGLKRLPDVVRLAKAQPGQLSFGTIGVGSVHHIYLEMLKDAAQVDIVNVPYKGGGPLMSDLLGGHVDLALVDPGAYRGMAASGKVHGLAINGPQRLPDLPDVPTFVEQGVPGPATRGWFGLFAPRGTQATVVERLATPLVALLGQSGVRAKLYDNFGAVAVGNGPAAFRQRLQREFDAWSAAIKRYQIPMN